MCNIYPGRFCMVKAQNTASLIHQLLPMIMLTAAFWPVLTWYLLRTFDRSDEPWGILALFTAGYFAMKSSRDNFATNHRCSLNGKLALLSVMLYVLSFSIADRKSTRLNSSHVKIS